MIALGETDVVLDLLPYNFFALVLRKHSESITLNLM